MDPIPLAENDAWNNATGNSRGKSVLIRYRPNLEKFLGDARYPKLLTIAWQYDELNSSGMPSSEQSDEMRIFEDLVQSQLDQDGTAILAFVHTRSGIRRWNYYISDTDAVGARINEALSDRPGLPIELSVEDDAEWSEMRLLLDQCH